MDKENMRLSLHHEKFTNYPHIPNKTDESPYAIPPIYWYMRKG